MPGRMTRIGSGQRSRMTWICPGEVWVRRMTSGSVVKKVSCISRAGWKRREVEQLEVVLVGLDVARAVDLEAHLRPDGGDPAQDQRRHVQPAAPRRPAGQGDVEGLGAQAGLQRGALERRLALVERLLQPLLRQVGLAAEGRALARVEVAEAAEQALDRALLAQMAGAPGGQLGFAGDRGKLRQRLRLHPLQLVEHLTTGRPAADRSDRQRDRYGFGRLDGLASAATGSATGLGLRPAHRPLRPAARQLRAAAGGRRARLRRAPPGRSSPARRTPPGRAPRDRPASCG